MQLTSVLKKPIITEKSLAYATKGQYTFEVDRRAKKPEIARAVAEAFGVKVLGVKTINTKGKKRKAGARRKKITLSGIKKAIVQLPADQKIDLFSSGEKEAEKKG